MRVAHLLNVIGKEGQDMFETFTLLDDGQKDIKTVLEEFEARCAPITNVIYERYLFNKRTQEIGESLDHYLTDIIKQADLCKYRNLRDELIRDRLVSGIRDDRARERLLSKKDINLAKTIELSKASEATQHQAQDMASTDQDTDSTIQAIKTNSQYKKAESSPQQTTTRLDKLHRPCRYCGRRQEFTWEACPAIDKLCTGVIRRATLPDYAEHQRFTTLRKWSARMRKCSLLTWSGAQQVNLQ